MCYLPFVCPPIQRIVGVASHFQQVYVITANTPRTFVILTIAYHLDHKNCYQMKIYKNVKFKALIQS
jgi:hypothetical protein